jgi:hypothetical protein
MAWTEFTREQHKRTAVAAMLKTIFAQESKAEAQWDTVAFTGLTRRHWHHGPCSP